MLPVRYWLSGSRRNVVVTWIGVTRPCVAASMWPSAWAARVRGDQGRFGPGIERTPDGENALVYARRKAGVWQIGDDADDHAVTSWPVPCRPDGPPEDGLRPDPKAVRSDSSAARS